MTPKVIKCLVLLLSVLCFGTNLQAQCNSETVNSSLLVSFDACVSNTMNGTNIDYSEFTASASNSGVCNNVSLAGPGHLYRNNPSENPHSCTPGVNDTPGMCVPYDRSCEYTPGTDQAVRFDVLVDPTNGPTTLSSFSFYELSSPIFQYINGNNGQNNRPLLYAVRVLVNGQEVYSESEIPTSQEWSLETFDFSGNQAFTVSSATTFNFELTAYCADFIGGAVSVWDLDELSINTTCNSSTVVLNADIDIAGGTGQTATSCNGTTFNFVTGNNPAGSTCTWYFDWPSTDPSTIFVGANPVYTFPEEGIYTIRKEVVLGDCFEASELTVSAFNNGVVGGGDGVDGSTDGFNVDVSGCNGATVNLNLVSTAFDQNDGFEVNSWDWTITVNGVAQAATGPTVALTLNDTDNVLISLLATSSSGCQNIFSESFNVNDLFPNASFIAVLEECTDNGFIVSFTNNANTEGFTVESYSWSAIVDGQAIDPGNVSSFTVETMSDIVSITHDINFTNGCTAQTNSQSISVNNDLVPDFDISIVTDPSGGGGSDDCGTQSVQVNATGGSINGNITSIDWVVSVGSNTFNFTGNPIDLNGIVTETAVITATINYDNGCSFTVSETFIPDSFPGGTGTLDVTFNGNPVIDCPGDATPLLINPNPNYVYNWSPTTGLTFTDNVNFSDPIVSVSEITTYAVTVTDDGCTFEGSVQVIPQNLAIPSIQLTGDGVNGNEFCDGIITASVANPIPGVQYEWSCGSDFTQIVGSGTSLNYNAGSFTTKEICVRIAGANAACDIHACDTAFGQIEITFNGNPVIDCPGDNTPLILNGNPNYTYNWSPTTGLTFTDNVNFSDPVVSVTEITTYSVTVTGDGCSATGSVSVIPQNLAIPTIDLDGTGAGGNEFCSGIISASVVDPIPGVQYEWSCGSDFTEIIGNGTSLSYNAGTFDTKEICVRIAGANAACDIHACETAIFGGDLGVTFNGNPVIDCNGDDTPLLLDADPNYSYTWDPTDGLTFTDMVNFSDPIVSVTEITTYNVTITDGACVLETSILVIPEDLAAPGVDQLGFGPSEDIYCNGMIELALIGAIDGVEYEWSCGPEFTEIIGTGTTLSYDAGLDFDVKEICVRIAGANAACDISTCVEVINGNPDLEYENPLTMCPGDTIQYEIINNNPDDAIVIVFEDDSHIIEFDENGLPVIGVGENEDVFGIPFTVTNEYCTLTDTLIVEPGTNPQLAIVDSIAVCGGTTMCFEALNIDPENGVPFWDFGDLSTESDTSSAFNPCYTYPDLIDGQSSFYEVTLMDFSDLCPGIPITMEIEIAPEPIITITAGDTITFDEYPVFIEAETNGNPEDIVWCDEDGMPIGNGPSIEVEEGVGACVFAKITNVNNCSDTAKVTLIMDDGPFNDIEGIEGPTDAVCANDTFNLTLLVENPDDYTYAWGPIDCIVEGGDTPMPLVSVQTVDKEFAVTVTDIETMTDSIFTYNVTVTSVVVDLECDFEDGVINFGSDGTISVVSPTNATYEWSNGETGSSITVSPEDATTYSVTVTDENGCTGVASKDVEVREVMCTEEEVFVPNAFTPNGDGINDMFLLRSLWVEEITTFIVYDRWGEEVYNNSGGNIADGWDGRFDGVELAPDVFAFCIIGTCINGEEFTRVGNVSLMK